MTFQVTDACNLACTYCYQICKGKHTMPFEVAKRFIDMLLADKNPYINTENSSGLIMEFIGGEPFLEIDLIDQITNYFLDQMLILQHPWATRYRISICSNGVLYFDPRVQTYIRKHLDDLSFSISIDGNKELHDSCRIFPNGQGSYDVAIAGVQHFTQVFGGSMGSKMTLAPENIHHAFAAIQNLVELGYHEIFMNCVYEKGWTTEHAKILYEQLKLISDYVQDKDVYISILDDPAGYPIPEHENQNWCGGNGEMISVDYKGDIYPCIRYMESSLGSSVEPIIIGNVYSGIMTTSKQKKCVECLQCVTRKSQSTEKCINCPIATGCSWCTAYNYQEFGTPNKRATYICEMHIARSLAIVYHKKGKLPNQVPKDWALNIISEAEWDLLGGA